MKYLLLNIAESATIQEFTPISRRIKKTNKYNNDYIIELDDAASFASNGYCYNNIYCTTYKFPSNFPLSSSEIVIKNAPPEKMALYNLFIRKILLYSVSNPQAYCGATSISILGIFNSKTDAQLFSNLK